MTPLSEPKIVAFASGKGGVGKTMLAVAFAKELSKSNKTLLFDLDFFNRGLTGLLRQGKKVLTIPKPGFLIAPDDPDVAQDWEIIRVAPNLFHVEYPDLTDSEIRMLETQSIAELSSRLRSYLESIAELSGTGLIVLDCHGGPDHLSFAACEVASTSILVSEPDKITFYGTMHFVRQLIGVTSPTVVNRVHLVFNKVVPAFSVAYLTHFYNTTVRTFFGDKPLLSIIPLEVYLTKEFENTPFLTDVYPYSALAKKMRLLAYDLFHKSDPSLLPRSFRRINTLDRVATRLTLAKIPAVLDMNFIMAFITISFITAFLFLIAARGTFSALDTATAQSQTLELRFLINKGAKVPESCLSEDPRLKGMTYNLATCLQYACSESNSVCDPAVKGVVRKYGNGPVAARNPDAIDEIVIYDSMLHNSDPAIRSMAEQVREAKGHVGIYRILVFLELVSPYAAIALVGWFLGALLLTWSASLDRIFTYDFRLRKFGKVSAIFLVAAGLWSTCIFYFTGVPELWKTDLLSFHVMICLGFLPALVAACDQCYKGVMEIVTERRYGEGAVRLGFFAFLVAEVFTMKLGNFLGL